MGYASYWVEGKGWCGYGHEAACEEPGCGAKIDRGLAYLCGKTPGGDEHGCGGYFCGAHLTPFQQCPRCRDDRDCEDCCDGVIWCECEEGPLYQGKRLTRGQLPARMSVRDSQENKT